MHDETIYENVSRVALVASLVLLVYFGPFSWWGVLAIVLAASALFGFGPLPRVFGRGRAFRKKAPRSAR